MNHSTSPLRRRGLAIAALAVGLLGGCMKAPDLTAVKAERAKPISRTDSFQSASSNGKVLVAGTAANAILSSSDGGQTWSRHALAAPSSVTALATCADGTFVGVDFYRKVWIGDASGTQWSAQPTVKGFDALAVTCDPSGRIWLAGSRSTLLSSADKGKTWKAVDFGEDALLTTIQFIDADHGVVTGEFGTALATADGGATWQALPKMPNEFYPYATLFTDQRNGWSSGLAGVILRTSDGGKTWAPQANESKLPMYSLLSQGPVLYGLGAGGQMVMLQGDTWSRFDHGLSLPAYLSAGAVLDAQSMLVVGPAGALHVVKATGRVALATAKTQGEAP